MKIGSWNTRLNFYYCVWFDSLLSWKLWRGLTTHEQCFPNCVRWDVNGCFMVEEKRLWSKSLENMVQNKYIFLFPTKTPESIYMHIPVYTLDLQERFSKQDSQMYLAIKLFIMPHWWSNLKCCSGDSRLGGVPVLWSQGVEWEWLMTVSLSLSMRLWLRGQQPAALCFQ